MKVSLKWLRDYAKLEDQPQVLAEQLINAGVEVDHMDETLAGVVVAKVLAIEPVPESTKGVVFADIDTGAEQIRVLTGAPNLEVGQMVPYAPPGTWLPGWEEPLAIRPMFGGKYHSPGMLCADDELGIGHDHSGIHIFNGNAKVGDAVAALLGTDVVFTVEVTPNRYDAACHLGLARELAAVRGEKLTVPTGEGYPTGDLRTIERVSVEVEDEAGCARFTVLVIEGVTVKPSPEWMQERLQAAGIRPINNVVDVTNFIALESGEPLHAFDYNKFCKIGGSDTAKMVVRLAKAGERLMCLDGVERQLSEQDVVVCSQDVPTSLAGVMGGLDSGISDDTKTVILEAATWDGPKVRATSQRLALRSEASTRFSKALSDQFTDWAIGRAANLICEASEGKASQGLVDVWKKPLPEPGAIAIDLSTVSDLLGFSVGVDAAKEKLKALGFNIEEGSGKLTAKPPKWRRDVWIEEDVAEEIGRMLGYDNVPATLPGSRRNVSSLAEPPDSTDAVREICIGAGFDEAITWSFSSQKLLDLTPGVGAEHAVVSLSNPLNENWTVMRTTQLPGLLQAMSYNLNHDVDRPQLFEIGHCFWADVASDNAGSDHVDKKWPDLPKEPLVISFAAHCHSSAEAEEAISRINSAISLIVWDVFGKTVESEPKEYKWLHPSRSGQLLSGGHAVGLIGEVSPRICAAAEIMLRVVVAEVDLSDFLQEHRQIQYQMPGRFPSVVEDIAVVVAAHTLAKVALAEIRAVAGELLETVELYDEYRDKKMDATEKSWTFRLTFRASDRTLVAEEVKNARQRVVEALQASLGAKLRS